MNLDSIRNYLHSINSPLCMVLVGPPLSGKDTFISKIELTNTEIISRDSILLEMCPNMTYNQAWTTVDHKLVDKTLKSKIRQAVDENKSVIINMTNLRKKGRRSLLLKFGNDYRKIAVIFPILSIEEYQKRNTIRTNQEGKTISLNIIKEMIDGYEYIDETENFDKVINFKY